MRNPHIDRHTAAASCVVNNQYFKVVEFSSNENPGLLVGTVVKKVKEPESRPSKYWNGLYWTVCVVCPNGEIRKVCCDVLTPIPDDEYHTPIGEILFERQQSVFEQVVV